MAEDDGFEEGLDELFAFGVEVGGGFELEAELFVGLAFVVVEDERVVTESASAARAIEEELF